MCHYRPQDPVAHILFHPNRDQGILIGPIRPISPIRPILHLHQEVPLRPAGGAAVRRFDQDPGGFSEEPGAEAALEIVVEVAEDAGSLFLDLRRDLGPHLRGGSALAGGKGEDVHLCEADLPGESDRLLEVGIGLAGETDDNIGRDGGAVQAALDQGDPGAEIIGGVGPRHAAKDVV